MQEMKNTMLRQNKAVIQQRIARADVETREIELSMQTLPTGNNNDLVATSPEHRESQQSRRELLGKLENQQAANQTFIKTCGEALSQTVYQSTGQKIKVIRATNNSSARLLPGSSTPLEISQRSITQTPMLITTALQLPES
jgi:predicted negative regulator of RcsB-dependent stress response